MKMLPYQEKIVTDGRIMKSGQKVYNQRTILLSDILTQKA